eukprot:27605_1
MEANRVIILVYSICNTDTFDETEMLREKILITKDDEDVQMVLCGNKCDLENQLQVPKEQEQNLANTWGCPFKETNAKEKINHKEFFYEIVRLVRKPKAKNELKVQKKKKERKSQ